eukprot:TRINITY_DN11776_c0_g1_i3.p1 TRINITY_DN11776_c0_g1~~TRINITY_DN11776_c0_g1_i3.p1  ORF type:complete len:126 (+),score=20.24 TRINITY_DN11776_c0_g1_i3:267-644(+)
MSTIRKKHSEIKDMRRVEDHMQHFIAAKKKMRQVLKDYNQKKLNVPRKGSFKGYKNIFAITPTHIDRPRQPNTQHSQLIIQGTNKCFTELPLHWNIQELPAHDLHNCKVRALRFAGDRSKLLGKV